MLPLLTTQRRALRILLIAGTAVAVAGCLAAAPSVRPTSLASVSPPSATQTPGGARPSPGVTAGTGGSPTKAPASLGSTWSAIVDVPAATAVTAGGPGWVAVGGATPIGDPGSEYHVAAAWTSIDGRSWVRSPSVAMPEGAASGEMTAVASTAAGLVAVGTVDFTAGTVWRSTDGSTWDVIGSGSLFDLGPCIEGCASLGSVAAGPAGIVVAGYRVMPAGSKTGLETDLWHSTDGVSWKRLRPPTPAGAAETPAAEISVAAGNRGFTAAGTLCRSDGITCRAVAWTSRDGRTWELPVGLPNGSGARALRVVAGPRATVVLGQRCDQDPCRFAAWAASDSTSWKEAIPAGSGPISATTLGASAGGRFIVLGSEDGEVRAWTSSDGLAWQPEALEPGPFPPAREVQIIDVAGGPEAVVAIGVLGEPQRPGVWVSP